MRRSASEQLRAFEHGEPLVVSVDGESHELGPDDLTIVRRASGSLVVQEEGGFFAAIDPAVTPELRREGHGTRGGEPGSAYAKGGRFAVSDRSRSVVGGGAEVQDVIEAHGAWIAEEVLATELVFVRASADSETLDAQAIDLDGITASVAITRIE